jgi:predicted O-linked N-acetylglucosamine transferase (SPINDLY family)
MNILFKKPNSVLWLIDDNPIAVSNLKNFADKNRVNPDRIIFAKRTNLSEHLARHKHADLFLDTFPYNAHTTASDSLWAGLPVLTCKGNSFASRVASSLLSAVSLQELIVSNIYDYESLAISLANNPVKLNEIRQKLLDSIKTSKLFDSKVFANNIELLYKEMYKRHQNELPVDNICIG